MFTGYVFLRTHHFDVGLQRKKQGYSHSIMGNNTAKVARERGLKSWPHTESPEISNSKNVEYFR